MNELLTKILTSKAAEVEFLKKRKISILGKKPSFPLRDFKKAISIPDRINLIAEIKFASPSAGLICRKKDPLIIGKQYEDAGAAAISLITEGRFFKGELKELPRLKRGLSLPILRKDFIIDEIQILESFILGADAVLFIARILSLSRIKSFIRICKELGMAALTEVHSREEVEKALESGSEIIGINNRDLTTFQVDLETTLKLSPLIPKECTLVCESGIQTPKDMSRFNGNDIQAVLVGSALMGSADLAGKTRELVLAGLQAGKA